MNKFEEEYIKNQSYIYEYNDERNNLRFNGIHDYVFKTISKRLYLLKNPEKNEIKEKDIKESFLDILKMAKIKENDNSRSNNITYEMILKDYSSFLKKEYNEEYYKEKIVIYEILLKGKITYLDALYQLFLKYCDVIKNSSVKYKYDVFNYLNINSKPDEDFFTKNDIKERKHFKED